jgi:hypothetical protein
MFCETGIQHWEPGKTDDSHEMALIVSLRNDLHRLMGRRAWSIDVSGPLYEIKYMAEIAAKLSDSLDSNEAKPGFFQISLGR